MTNSRVLTLSLVILLASAVVPAEATNTFPASGNVGINTTSPNTDLEVAGALRLSTSTEDTFVSPLGSNIPTKINIPLFDPGAYGQILAMGLPSTAQTTARAITMLDARTVAHQPTIEVLSPDENQVIGFSFDGSNTTGYLKSSVAFGFMANGTDALHVTTSGLVGIGTTSPTDNLQVIGDVLASDTTGGYSVALTSNPSAGPFVSWNNGGSGLGATAFMQQRYSTYPGTPNLLLVTNSVGGDIALTGGNVGIGLVAPTEALEVYGRVKVDTFASGGSMAVCANGNLLSDCSSSIRYKEKVKKADFGLKDVMEMRPVTFKWKDRDEKDFGLVAEEMEKINPLFVTYKGGQIEGVKYPQLTAVLVKATQEQEAKIEALEARIEALEAAGH